MALISQRATWLAVLARADLAALERRLTDAPELPRWERLRGPEQGLSMVRGRIGGDGAPFNLGEVPIARCSVCLPDGTVGHATAIGRDLRKAELAAVLDAALQDPERRPAWQAAVIGPLAAEQAARVAAEFARAAATRVEFSTLAGMR